MCQYCELRAIFTKAMSFLTDQSEQLAWILMTVPNKFPLCTKCCPYALTLAD